MNLPYNAHEFDYVRELMDAGLYPYFNAFESAQDTEVKMHGKSVVMLGSNNYMGLTNDPRTIAAAKAALDKYGAGCSGSRFLNGTLVLHETLERELAQFFHKDEAVTFSTGFQANLGIVSALADRHTYILNDAENHASIIDACRLSFAKHVYKYEHNDMESLDDILSRIPLDAPKIIITDGVFSMSGDIANLPGLVALKKKYHALLMIDDAHGVGMIGDCGRGCASHFGLEDDVDIIMTTFSKSFGALGGCMASNRDIAFYVRHKSRPFIFSASIPPANAASVLEALRIIRTEPQRQRALIRIANYLREKLAARGINVLPGKTGIVPIRTYTIETTLKAARALLEGGVYVNPVLPPAVEPSMCMLRMSVTATHSLAQIDRAIDVIDEVLSGLSDDSEKTEA